MTEPKAIDYSTLGWVKKELDETFRQAVRALEAYVSDQEDQSQLRFCITYLHQAYGTLQMVELVGPALLAAEMEYTALALMSDGIEKREPAFEALMRGLLQLPDYLERLQSGKKDVPVALLPTINELRGVRDANALPESALFQPDLSVPVPAAPGGAQGQDARALAKSVRNTYQLALVQWFKDPKAKGPIKSIREALSKLQHASSAQSLAQLWWVAAGFAEALEVGALQANDTTRQLLGQIDRQIKRLMDKGESELAARPALWLTKTLLYHIALAARKGDAVIAIKDAFLLDGLLPSEDEVLEAREALIGANLDLLKTVVDNIKEDLARTKDALEIFGSSRNRDPKDLASTVERLHKVAETLGMVGLVTQRKVLQEQADAVQEYVDGKREPEDSRLVQIASTLLNVETTLDDLAMGQASQDTSATLTQAGMDSVGPETAQFESWIADAKYRQIQLAVMQEAIHDIARIKEAVVAFAGEDWKHEALAEVPSALLRIKGGMQMIGQKRVVTVVDAVRDYVENTLLGRRARPSRDQLEALAEAVSAIEYYFEAVRENRASAETILELAEGRFERLQGPPESEGAAESVTSEMDETLVMARPILPVAEDDAARSAITSPPPADESSIMFDVPAEAVARFAADASHAQPAPAAPVQPSPVPSATPKAAAAEEAEEYPVFGNDVDQETLEIFLEEATEELASLQKLLPQWMADQSNVEVLQTVRRSFHTLKGSGRLVGAIRMGEFAWSFEYMLNRVLEKTLEVSRELLDLLQEALDAMPGLVAQLRGEGGDEPRVRNIMDRADLLSRMPPGRNAPRGFMLPKAGTAPARTASEPAPGPVESKTSGAEKAAIESPAADQPESVGVASDSLVLDAGPAAAPAASHPDASMTLTMDVGLMPEAPGMDAVLFEIFSQEARSHLAAIETFIDRGSLHVTDDLVRALHTLHGSARMAGADRIGDIGGRFEQYCKKIAQSGRPLPAEARTLLLDGVDAIRKLIPALVDPQVKLPVLDGMWRSLDALERGAAEEDERRSEELSTGAEVAEIELAPIEPPAEALSEAPGEDLSLAPEIAEIELAPVEPPSMIVAEEPAGPAPADVETFEPVIEFAEPATPMASAQDSGAAEPSRDEELVAIFVDEATGLLGRFAETLSRLEGDSADREAIGDLQRHLHTLKGGARLASVQPIADICNGLERIADHLHEHSQPLPAEAQGVLQGAWSRLQTMLDAVRSRGHVQPAEELLARIRDLQSKVLGDVPVAPMPVAEEPVAPAIEAPIEPQSVASAPEFAVEAPAAPEPEAIDAPVEIEAAPAPAAAEPAGDALGDIDSDLLEIFLEEGGDLLDQSEETLHSWNTQPENRDLVRELQRQLHTLKGGARLAGIRAVGDLSHALESILTAIAEGRIEAKTDWFDLMHEALDRLAQMVERLRAGRAPAYAADLLQSIRATLGDHVPAALLASLPEPIDPTSAPAAPGHVPEVRPAPEAPERAGEVIAESMRSAPAVHGAGEVIPAREAVPSTPRPMPPTDERRRIERATQDTIRVRADLIDSLVNQAGEVSIYRARLEQQMSSFGFNLIELDQTIARLRDQLRKMEMETEAQISHRYEREGEAAAVDFDPLEFDRFSSMQQLSRSLMESAHDLGNLRSSLENLRRESETLLVQQSRVSTDLTEGLMRSRMVQFAGLLPRLRRIVRQTSTELGKRADLTVEGADVEMDTTVIDRIVPALEHLLRNSVAHGIEKPDARRAAGKAEMGEVRISLAREGADVLIQVGDDGAGINLEAIRRKAVERGLITADAKLGEDDLKQFILESGLSTSDRVSQVSGRGVGMDVVVSETKQLGGSLHIDSHVGRGTVFTLRLPFTLAINRALLVRIGDDYFAVPLISVAGVVRMSAKEVEALQSPGSKGYEFAGKHYLLQPVGRLLGAQLSSAGEARRVPVVLVRTGEHYTAFEVDAVLGSREIVVKSVGPQISSVRGVLGATILGDGRVVLILDVGTLVRLSLAGYVPGKLRELQKPAAAAPEPKREILVMVVDDSITIRKVTTRLLERYNMQVVTAKDGVEALEKLQEQKPDVMLLDIEMPRMDGYELATRMRGDEDYKSIPIIMITSRTGEKHRQRAMDIGVNRYLGKPYQEGELLDTIRELAGVHSPEAVVA